MSHAFGHTSYPGQILELVSNLSFPFPIFSFPWFALFACILPAGAIQSTRAPRGTFVLAYVLVTAGVGLAFIHYWWHLIGVVSLPLPLAATTASRWPCSASSSLSSPLIGPPLCLPPTSPPPSSFPLWYSLFSPFLFGIFFFFLHLLRLMQIETVFSTCRIEFWRPRVGRAYVLLCCGRRGHGKTKWEVVARWPYHPHLIYCGIWIMKVWKWIYVCSRCIVVVFPVFVHN